MSSTMTAVQCLKHEILLVFWLFNDEEELFDLTGPEIDELYAKMDEKEHAVLEEAKDKIRTDGFETKIVPESHEKYSSVSLAAHTHDHRLIGWTCFYGPMYSRPETVEWVEKAYFIQECTTQKTITVTEYSKA
jgi:hypothetical protein